MIAFQRRGLQNEEKLSDCETIENESDRSEDSVDTYPESLKDFVAPDR